MREGRRERYRERERVPTDQKTNQRRNRSSLLSEYSMENAKESNGGGNGSWMSVPAFGDWDMKHGVPDYSMDFTKIREMRKQNKKDFSRISLGNEEELMAKQKSAPVDEMEPGHSHRVAHHVDEEHREQHEQNIKHGQIGRKKFKSYFGCCVGA